MIAGCEETAVLTNTKSVEVPAEEVKAEMHSVPIAKPKKPWITWTRVDTTATIVATVAVLEFIAIGYGVLRYTTNQRIKNKAEGYATG